MNQDFSQALRQNRVGFLWIDHESDFADYDDVRFEIFSTGLSNFKQSIDSLYAGPRITVLYARQSSLYDGNGERRDWYDGKNLRINSEQDLQDFLFAENIDILHPFNVSEPLCLKLHSSCLQDTELTSYLQDRNVSHLFMGGAYLNACVKASAEDALAEFHVGIVHDVTYASHEHLYSYERDDYPRYIRRIFDDQVLVTDTKQVLAALKAPGF